MSEPEWSLRGEYMESCDCDFLCPCIYTNPQGPATNEHCTAVMVFRIDDGHSGPLRHVLEVRHRSFRTPEFCELLRAHDIGMVVADSAGTWPMFDEVTSGVAYVRLHGDTELYASGYSDAALDHWAGKVRAWEADGLDVFVYFDNDAKVHAPFDAIALQERLGIGLPS